MYLGMDKWYIWCQFMEISHSIVNTERALPWRGHSINAGYKNSNKH